MYQKQIIVGRLTRDMEQKTLGESLLTTFSVAVDDGFGEKKTTDFFNVSAWNAVGKGVAPYLTKGTIVLVEGKMKMRKSDNVTYWDLRADRIQLVGGSQSGGQAGGSQSVNQGQPQYNQQPQYQQQYQQPQYSQQQYYQQAPQNQMQDPYAMSGISGDDLPF